MGKVVKIVAVIAIAAAIAYFAPYLSGTVLGLAGSAATAAVAATLSLAASMAFAALAPKPGSHAPGGQPSAPIALEWGRHGKENWPIPAVDQMPPVDAGWRCPIFYPWQRFAVVKTRGNCMLPSITGRWAVVERDATIKRGDYFLFGINDLRRYFKHDTIQAFACNGLGKEFDGYDPIDRTVAFHSTNPLIRMQTGIDRVKWAYRVAAVERTRLAAWRALRLLARG